MQIFARRQAHQAKRFMKLRPDVTIQADAELRGGKITIDCDLFGRFPDYIARRRQPVFIDHLNFFNNRKNTFFRMSNQFEIKIRRIDQRKDAELCFTLAVLFNDLLQQSLLRRWRADGRPEDASYRALVATVNGISAGLQNTG